MVTCGDHVYNEHQNYDDDSFFLPIPMIDNPCHGSSQSIRRHSQTSESYIFN